MQEASGCSSPRTARASGAEAGTERDHGQIGSSRGRAHDVRGLGGSWRGPTCGAIACLGVETLGSVPSAGASRAGGDRPEAVAGRLAVKREGPAFRLIRQAGRRRPGGVRSPTQSASLNPVGRRGADLGPQLVVPPRPERRAATPPARRDRSPAAALNGCDPIPVATARESSPSPPPSCAGKPGPRPAASPARSVRDRDPQRALASATVIPPKYRRS